MREQARDDSEDFRNHTKSVTLLTALFVLAHSFCGSQGESARAEFLKAYVQGGTVVNPHSSKRGLDEDIHSSRFLQSHITSHRSATMPRDYIFATMPSFPWYTYPKKEALAMSFGEIYSDLYQQAERSGHAFTCRFTRSMLDPACTDPTDGWLPSQHLPSPTTLGDFLKLMGNRVPEASNATSPHVHITSGVQIEEHESESSPDVVLSHLEECARLFRQQLGPSVIVSELLNVGDHPDHRWRLDHTDATRCGWVPIDPEYAAPVYDDSHHTPTRIGPGLGFKEGDCVVDVGSLDETDQEARLNEAGEYLPLFVQARRILGVMWWACELHSIHGAQNKAWDDFKQHMQGLWSTPLLWTMLLLAGMVNCRIPLSAAAWVNKLFVPVYIRHNEDLLSVGLLAKHARQPKHQRQVPLSLLCVGQHRGRKAFGQDLFLVDPSTKVPVGLAPDMLPEVPVCKGEEFAKVALSLYRGCCTALGDNKVKITYRRLSKEPSVPRDACVANLQ